MTKQKILHYLILGVEALFLLNFSTICVFCFIRIFEPIIFDGGFFQSFILEMMFNEISSSYVIIFLRLFFFLSAVYLWFKKQNWLTAAYLIIAGTAAGLLGVYFFAFYYLSVLGCLAVLLFCYLASLCLKGLSLIWKKPLFSPFRAAWKNFWTPGKIAIACAICAIFLLDRFIPWEFPIFGKPLPYYMTGLGWFGGPPPREYDITIAVDLQKHPFREADIAATCAAAARYFSENYGMADLKINMYDYLPETGDCENCFYMLATCHYSPKGISRLKKDGNGKIGWSDFEVARDFPLAEIQECNRLTVQTDKMNLHMAEADDWKRKQMGNWAFSKLTPDFLNVRYELLPNNLCQAPAPDSKMNWSLPVSKKELLEECKALYTELKLLGSKPDFPACYQKSCDNKNYLEWVRRIYMLWEKRAGSFAPEIFAYNESLNELAKAYAQRDAEKAAALIGKLDKILAKLQTLPSCGNE